MGEWLRYWTLNHEIVGLSPANYTRSFVPKVLGQDLYPKCALRIVNMQLLACRERRKINPSLKKKN